MAERERWLIPLLSVIVPRGLLLCYSRLLKARYLTLLLEFSGGTDGSFFSLPRKLEGSAHFVSARIADQKRSCSSWALYKTTSGNGHLGDALLCSPGRLCSISIRDIMLVLLPGAPYPHLSLYIPSSEHPHGIVPQSRSTISRRYPGSHEINTPLSVEFINMSIS